ncbi:MAG: hypothetical protein KKG60_03450 [Nanoarchaeota archaeon]|nr:hypothetical protein [Nanoarchaeota archaeon]
MAKSQKSIFIKAGILTAIIFGLGIVLGYTLESGRISEIEEEYKKVEIEWADAKLQSLYYQNVPAEYCKASIDENLRFADKVYQQGIRLEKYDNANKITEKFKLEKQKYALLKTEFLLNSISLKEKCSADYVNLVYFYKDEPNIEEKSAQRVQSVVLEEIKSMFGPDMMLIPLSIDIDISIINIIKSSYNITKTPTLIIEDKKFEGVISKEKILQEICPLYKEEIDACKGY